MNRKLLDRKLLLVFLLALILRVVSLGSVPWGFHNDEVDVGYVGKYLILHGRDPAGNTMPVTFNKFGDFRPAGLFYLAGISELILGTNEFAVRLPTALFGALTVFPLFLLAKIIFGVDLLRGPVRSDRLSVFSSQLSDLGQSIGQSISLKTEKPKTDKLQSENRKQRPDNSYFVTPQSVAYLSAFFLAILPWHLELSRAGHEAIVGYFLILYGFFYLFKYLKDGQSRKKFLVYSFLFLVSSYFFYHGTRLIVPLLLGSFLPFFKKRELYGFFAIFMFLTTVVILSPYGRGRLSQVAFYNNPNAVKKLTELTFADRGNITAARIFHNKAVVYSRELVGSYAQYFSPDFLFLRGGYPERYLVVEVGLLYIIFAPILLLGIIFLFQMRRAAYLPLMWLFLAPTAAVLTFDDIPSVTRASFMIFPLSIICASGLVYLLNLLKNFRKPFIYTFSIVLFLEMVFFAHQYQTHQRLYKGILRDDGALKVAKYIYNKRENYDLVVVAYGSNFPLYYLFFNNIFDKNIRVDLSRRDHDFAYGNVKFIRDSCPTHRRDHYTELKVLYINEAGCEQKPADHEVYEFVREDLTIAFSAFE